jgi:hypothetical protein
LAAALRKIPDAGLPGEFAADEGALEGHAAVVRQEFAGVVHRGVAVELIGASEVPVMNRKV